MNNTYVYTHTRLDNNEIFYIGIGKTKNYNRSKIIKRSKFWTNITNKTEYKIEIIYDNLSWEDASLLEIFLIKLYGRKDLNEGSLVNLTNGGDGGNGVIQSKETIHKRVLKLKGQKRSEEVKKQLSILATGRKHSEETKLKISNLQKGKICSKETIEKRTKLTKGLKRSEEVKLKMSLSNKKSIKVIDTVTKIIYPNISIAAKAINMTRMPLTRRLEGKIKNNTNLKFL